MPAVNCENTDVTGFVIGALKNHRTTCLQHVNRTICLVCLHASPAEADKSFLLPLTSSILRAKESISEPDLEASPLTHKHTHKEKLLQESTCENVCV